MHSIFAKYDTKEQMNLQNSEIVLKPTFETKLKMSVNESTKIKGFG
jgi:calcium/calmodulin-dependent protein kinase I